MKNNAEISMDTIAWRNFLCEIDNLQMFSLCKEFDELSLEDTGGSSSSPSASTSSSNSIVKPSTSKIIDKSSMSILSVKPSAYPYWTDFNHYFRSLTYSYWCRSIIWKLRAPFKEIPCKLIDISSKHESSNVKPSIYLSLGFRFLPGQSDFIFNILKLPESIERLSRLSDSLGLSKNSGFISKVLSFNRTVIPPDGLASPYCSSEVGLRGLVKKEYSQILVEIITSSKYRYGRFLVLVILGIGCTVWYGFVPGSPEHAPGGDLFDPLVYENFYNMDYNQPGLHKINLVERTDNAETLVKWAMENEPPFDDIQIPARGEVFKAVSTGVMISFIIAAAIVVPKGAEHLIGI